MNQLYSVVRLFYAFMPWLVEACGYALILPLVVGAEPFTATARALVLLVVLIVGSYYDRRLWQSHGRSNQADKPALQAGQVIIPILFYLFGGLTFGLVSSVEIGKLLVFVVVISVTKYWISELQSPVNQLHNGFRFLYFFLPWLAEALGYALIVPLVVGSGPFTISARAIVFLVVVIVGSYSDRRLWQSHGRLNQADKPSLQAGQVIIPILFYLFGGWIFSLVASVELGKLLFVAVIISVAKYLISELQSMSAK